MNRIPQLEKIPVSLFSSIAVYREVIPYIKDPWHYHPEYEILLVEKGYGIRLVGNHIGNFSDGDLVFISSDLPHVWKNDSDFYQDNRGLHVDAYVIQFLEDALNDNFFDLPEFTHIRKLFALGQQGVWIKKDTGDHKRISELVKAAYHSSGFDRLIFFLKSLDAFANATEYELLSSPVYTESFKVADADRINKVINILMDNYHKEVKLEEVANQINLNKSSFCRYFKSKTNKTLSRFLNEIRIARACKLLANNAMTVTEVCYSTGYNNLSYFNKQFKLITGLTAREYKKKFNKTLFAS
jgi:AraC-like DNA-binding protein